MSLQLMYITNNTDVAKIAEHAGVDMVLVDMEYIGKAQRQADIDGILNHHTIEDVRKIRQVLHKTRLAVRINPLHAAAKEHCSSLDEINSVIEAGADLIMLPYFISVNEVEEFIRCVDKRAETCLLFESKGALEHVDEILELPGIDRIHIGINDLSLDLGKKFMFETLADGTVEYLCCKFKQKGIPYGFGGFGRLGTGELPAEFIIKEHYRLGSTSAFLSRSFCNLKSVKGLDEIKHIFEVELKKIRELEAECFSFRQYFTDNEKRVEEKTREIVKRRQ